MKLNAASWGECRGGNLPGKIQRRILRFLYKEPKHEIHGSVSTFVSWPKQKNIFVDYGFLESTVHCTCSFFRVKIAKKTSCGEIDICRESLFRIRFRIHLHGKFSAKSWQFSHIILKSTTPPKIPQIIQCIHNWENSFKLRQKQPPNPVLYFFWGGKFFWGDSATMTHLIPPKKGFFCPKNTHKPKTTSANPRPSNTPR